MLFHCSGYMSIADQSFATRSIAAFFLRTGHLQLLFCGSVICGHVQIAAKTFCGFASCGLYNFRLCCKTAKNDMSYQKKLELSHKTEKLKTPILLVDNITFEVDFSEFNSPTKSTRNKMPMSETCQWTKNQNTPITNESLTYDTIPNHVCQM